MEFWFCSKNIILVRVSLELQNTFHPSTLKYVIFLIFPKKIVVFGSKETSCQLVLTTLVDCLGHCHGWNWTGRGEGKKKTPESRHIPIFGRHHFSTQHFEATNGVQRAGRMIISISN